MWPIRVAANSRWMDIYTMNCSSHFEKNMPIVGIQQSHHPSLTVIIGGIESQYLRAHTKQLHSVLQLICTSASFPFSISFYFEGYQNVSEICQELECVWQHLHMPPIDPGAVHVFAFIATTSRTRILVLLFPIFPTESLTTAGGIITH